MCSKEGRDKLPPVHWADAGGEMLRFPVIRAGLVRDLLSALALVVVIPMEVGELRGKWSS